MVASVKQGRPAFVLRGVLMVLFGLAVLALPGLTTQSVLVAFGGLLLLAGAVVLLCAPLMMQMPRDGWWLLAEGLLMMSIGLAALLVPDAAARAVVLLFGAWAIASGTLQLAAALRLRREARDSAGLLVSALLSIALGSVFMWRPDASLNAIVWLLGAFALASGALAFFLAARATALRCRPVAF